MNTRFLGIGAGLFAALGVVAFNATGIVQRTLVEVEPTTTFIVKARTAADAVAAVNAVNGVMIGELSVINAATAALTDSQAAALRRREGLQVYNDAQLEVSGDAPDTFYPAWVGADQLHASGIDGSGVAIAIIDTGLWPKVSNELAVEHGVDTVGLATGGSDLSFAPGLVSDQSGHGTHITSVAAGRELSAEGFYEGVAPGADVVVVRAFDDNGYGSYVDVIEGIQWVIDHHAQLNIRVLNLSFSAEPQSYYWDDPLNQAVMAAWEAGIVVITSAGNTGPDPMTVGVPGNVPYVVTVGSVDDNYTPDDHSDDFLSSFSSTGPTYEGFVKPEVTAPGGHMLAHMNPNGTIARSYSEYQHESGHYFTMSGTSQSSAVISGVAALVLQADPTLTPDDVKCRLLSSARPVVDSSGASLYSLFQQGAGLVFAPDAVFSQATACANIGLDVVADLAGEAHYVGAATQLEDGTFALKNPGTQELIGGEGSTWDGAYVFAQGYTWSGGDTGGTTDGYTWSGGDTGGTTDGYTWSGGDTGGTTDGYTWSGGDTGGTTNDGYTWSGGDTGGTTDFMPDLLGLRDLDIIDWVIPDPQRVGE
ncbi:S8 family peptidase [Abyssibacter sp.]|uniref:S8 family peptidase n=1 Tax=Abyssibacter sp. TaxID=2320200 RepID=UPI00351328F7